TQLLLGPKDPRLRARTADLAENPAGEAKRNRLIPRPAPPTATSHGLKSVDEGPVRRALIGGPELPLDVAGGGSSQTHLRHQVGCRARGPPDRTARRFPGRSHTSWPHPA